MLLEVTNQLTYCNTSATNRFRSTRPKICLRTNCHLLISYWLPQTHDGSV